MSVWRAAQPIAVAQAPLAASTIMSEPAPQIIPSAIFYDAQTMQIWSAFQKISEAKKWFASLCFLYVWPGPQKTLAAQETLKIQMQTQEVPLEILEKISQEIECIQIK